MESYIFVNKYILFYVTGLVCLVWITLILIVNRLNCIVIDDMIGMCKKWVCGFKVITPSVCMDCFGSPKHHH